MSLLRLIYPMKTNLKKKDKEESLLNWAFKFIDTYPKAHKRTKGNLRNITVDSPSPESCKNYKTCLNTAAKLNLSRLNCEGCSGEPSKFLSKLAKKTHF